MIAIIDSGGANIASVQFALERLDVKSVLTRDAAEIVEADRVLLPGVGAAPVAMKALRDAQLIEPIRQLCQPVLGICLGMQLLFGRSFEGNTDLLGILDGACQAFTPSEGRSVPHMGWNKLHPTTIRCWLVWMMYRTCILCIVITCLLMTPPSQPATMVKILPRSPRETIFGVSISPGTIWPGWRPYFAEFFGDAVVILYPAIDLISGTVVRLYKGDFDQLTQYGTDPVAIARTYANAGATWLHLVDLDGAKNPQNRQIGLISKLINSTGLLVQTGGGPVSI